MRPGEPAFGMRPWRVPAEYHAAAGGLTDGPEGGRLDRRSTGGPMMRSARRGSAAPQAQRPAGVRGLRSRIATDKLQSASCGDKMEDAIPPVRDRAGPSQEWC
ncbi:hypothetical protein Arub01_01090 [Actinomadura rubrobrunea]|uniref:Uncharacterized protein n=1 Tax=Actinomadura rubrobrunea TaxID=115335 RepID=A0A9W6UUN7_9ACTN|nr:hypothetical protein Arub01_01090 [Actinomadura rubrobrunea]